MKFKGVLVSLVAVLLMLGVAWAANPHFISATDSINRDGDLLVKFKEAGLGSNVLINYIVTADVAVTWQCVNKGGNCPQAANKTQVVEPVSFNFTRSSGKNGQITATFIVSPPGPGDFSCPGGQRLEVAAVTYSNVQLQDTTNGVFVDLRSLSSDFGVCP